MSLLDKLRRRSVLPPATNSLEPQEIGTIKSTSQVEPIDPQPETTKSPTLMTKLFRRRSTISPVQSTNPKTTLPKEPVGPAQHAPNIMQPMQNTGMLVGGTTAAITDNSVGAGLVDGLVVGNLVGQQVKQAENHAYWRDRAQQYKAGDETAAMGPVAEGARAERQAGREERRKERWGRREKRREG
ncbi:hypothetical protein BT63DRAFT_93028 [Microthyrium microscopicum]|uniref:Uncharacterized protein n=1 Tax=Microthyrium microscopicum TaxID=703497 RepID=A0A6A6TXN9_9PEZI|nr:hypothetical protein BT63DRAFT_93028 [Microthyrium microscopicum]